MRSLYEHLPPVEIAGRKVVGRVLFALLVLVSALVGATVGLLLVYTTDLPQVDALEAYRPSSITELYDDHGRVIGSFALQRRVVAGYDDFPQVLRDALVSIEDKDFYRHSGINFLRIFGAAYRDWHFPVPAAACLALLTGCAGGGLNALLIARFRIPPLIVTLGSFAARAVSSWFCAIDPCAIEMRPFSLKSYAIDP